MNLSFSVDQFLQTGLEKQIAETVDLPISMKDEGLAAVLVEMTVNGVTKEVWLRRSPTFDQIFVPVTFPDGMYEIAFDVDRLDLGFSLTLDDFDVGFDPGTSTASSYRSEVRLTDEAEHIKDKPVSIFMNNTLDHRGWRFFQTSYRKDIDLKSGRPTGKFVSVFQVAKNPARELIYAGCIIVVLGAFVQFYMRAGIFTDGGKLEQHKAAEKARKRLEAKSGKTISPATGTAEPDIETL
jgi:cytochrome c biogenesis protein ResB